MLTRRAALLSSAALLIGNLFAGATHVWYRRRIAAARAA